MDWLATPIYLYAVGCFAVVYLLAARKYWRGEVGDSDDEPPSAWPFSREHWHGVVRTYVAAGPCVLAFVGAGGVNWAFPVIEPTPLGSLLTGISAGALLLTGALYAGIILWNRPKALVPPHLRSAPGLLEVRRRRRRRRSARRRG